MKYFILAVRDVRKKSEETILQFLKQNFYVRGDKIYPAEGAVVFIKQTDIVREDYLSASSYAAVISEFILQELYINTVICAAQCDESNLSETLNSVLSGIKEKRSHPGIITPNAFKIKDMLFNMLSNQNDEYLKNLSGNKIFSDGELVRTARCFIENDLNVSRTARKGYFHRNTLNYRLNKIHKATGLNIKKFWDAAMFEIIILFNEKN